MHFTVFINFNESDFQLWELQLLIPFPFGFIMHLCIFFWVLKKQTDKAAMLVDKFSWSATAAELRIALGIHQTIQLYTALILVHKMQDQYP